MSDLPRQLYPAVAVQDPVHGRIWLTRLEIELINTPEFQRLRSIGQLTPVDLVFPGATHNRFAHSIGSAHVMGMILGQEKMQKYFCDGREDLVPVLRLAGLLHDVGHLPFSHVGEMAYTAAQRPGAFDYLDSEVDSVFDAAATAKPHALHEELSTLLIRGSRIADVIDGELPPLDGHRASEVVARIVGGQHSDLVARNLLSSDLDCDRLDYLLRDSAAAGLVYGHIDLAYLIGMLIVAYEENGEPALAIDARHGKLAGEHYLLARYYHYAQFITHKTVSSAEVDLTAAMIELVRLGALPAPEQLLSGPDSDRIEQLMSLTDQRVTVAMANASETYPSEAALHEAATRLRERKLLKAVARHEQLERFTTPGEGSAHPWDTRLQRPEDKVAVARECEVDPRLFCYRTTSLPLTGMGELTPRTVRRDPDRITRGWLKGAKLSDGDDPPRMLIEESAILGHLSNHEWVTRRVFFREDLAHYSPTSVSLAFGRLKRYFDRELARYRAAAG